MPTAQFDLEYSICQVQSGAFSMAVKSHRQEGGTPILQIEMGSTDVVWKLKSLDQGIPETVLGTERRDRVDFYFTLDAIRKNLNSFPPAQVSSVSSHRRPPRSSVGTERKEGKRVRLETPICAFYPIQTVVVTSQRPPAFRATAVDATLHLDMETGPKRIYGHEIFEVHFGIEALYTIDKSASGPSEVAMTMTHEVYATILNELRYSIK